MQKRDNKTRHQTIAAKHVEGDDEQSRSSLYVCLDVWCVVQHADSDNTANKRKQNQQEPRGLGALGGKGSKPRKEELTDQSINQSINRRWDCNKPAALLGQQQRRGGTHSKARRPLLWPVHSLLRF